MYLLVSEGNHYEFVPGPEHEHQWYVGITFGKFNESVLSYSGIRIDGKTGEFEYTIDLVESPIEGLSIHDDELQLVASSIIQDIIHKSVVERTGRFVDVKTGEFIEY